MPVRVIYRGRIFTHHGDADYQSIDLDGGFVEKNRKWIPAPEKVREFMQKHLPSEKEMENLVRAILNGQPYRLVVGDRLYRIVLEKHERGNPDRLYWNVEGETYVAVARTIAGDISLFIAKENSVHIPVGLYMALSYTSRKVVALKQRQNHKRRVNSM